ncbi:MAG: hypothetical protein GY822_16175 [Deltaproteobacteria bacterium]|nr:hypothetical protein [Deltaproteobacteria bacterium]
MTCSFFRVRAFSEGEGEFRSDVVAIACFGVNAAKTKKKDHAKNKKALENEFGEEKEFTGNKEKCIWAKRNWEQMDSRFAKRTKKYVKKEVRRLSDLVFFV